MATVQFAVTTPKVTVNNQTIAVKPNSVWFDEGLGEQKVDVQSAGGNAVQQVIKQDASTLKSMCGFKLENTEQNIEFARQWKLNPGANALTITSSISSSFSRSFTDLTLTNNYKVELGADTEIVIEFTGEQAA